MELGLPRASSAELLAIPHRRSLVSQTAACVMAEIESGKWNDWLPSERALAEVLSVSRNTLRAALDQMERSGILRAVHGSGHRILVKSSGPCRRPRSVDVALLTPAPLEHLRPTLTLWINELRALLNEGGCRLREFSGEHYFRADPEAALQRLTRLNPHGCWILALSTEAQQEWFRRKEVPCVIAGSCFAGIDLAHVDLDHRAMCRHAAGVLLGLGHRRIALLNQRVRRAGDLASEEGFVDGVRSSQHVGTEPMIVYHDPSLESVSHTVRHLMEQQARPTALLVANPFYYLTVTSQLAQLGWRVSRDISVLSRDEDPFLSFLLPKPSRYTIPSHVFARRLVRPVLELLGGGSVTQRENLIMPDFIRGDSLGPPNEGQVDPEIESRLAFGRAR